MRSATRGGTSARWRWGYANGDAHDLAMRLRRRLDGMEARMTFVNEAKGGREAYDDVKLALALAIQRAGNERRQEALRWTPILNAMAAGHYEESEGRARFVKDAHLAMDTAPTTPPTDGSEAAAMRAALAALDDVNFVDAGC